tara:strand:- start:830 stop:994 length:165 start_codon:yes stop_codon:yes gene_type:complete
MYPHEIVEVATILIVVLVLVLVTQENEVQVNEVKSPVDVSERWLVVKTLKSKNF